MERIEREYDIKRKEETLRTLKNGFKKLKDKKKRSGSDTPISKYALSKLTGISYKTINSYPEILDLLNKEQETTVDLKNIAVKTNKISNMSEAIMIINELNDMYNEAVTKVNDYSKVNTKLNYEIIKLKKEVKEFDEEIKRYKEKLQFYNQM